MKDDKKIGVFAGTFDPFTLGHWSVVRKAIPLFDEIHIVIGVNSNKKCMFSLDVRKKVIEQTFGMFDPDNLKIKVVTWDGLIIDYCKKVGAQYMIRGIRGGGDFDYENMICYANKKINPAVETMFFMTDAEYAGVSSTIVRELIKNNTEYDLNLFIHSNVNIGMLRSNKV